MILDCGVNPPFSSKFFLKKRYFKVRVCKTLSDSKIQEEGVPQGSVFSVTLFALAIDGISSVIPADLLFTLFVNDLSLSVTASRMSVAERKPQLSIDKVVNARH